MLLETGFQSPTAALSTRQTHKNATWVVNLLFSFLRERAVVFAAAPGESSQQIEEEEEEEEEEDGESGQTADCKDADRKPGTQSTDPGGDEENEIIPAIINLFQFLLESMTDGEQGESGPSNDASSSSQPAAGANARLCCDGSCSPINRSMYIRT